MKVRLSGVMAMVGVLAFAPGTVSACQRCHRNPCVYTAPAPAVQCVTEMVPYTVMQNRTRIEYREETCNVIERVPETTFEERQRVVCKPVFDTTTVQRTVNVRRPVFTTDYVTRNVTVCHPETTVQQVTEICMQPTTRQVTVPVVTKKCGHVQSCGCQTVNQTCYTPVPVTRNVEVTRMVPEVKTEQVPITRCSFVCEQKVVDVPVTTCRMVQEVVTEKIPHTTIHCVPKVVTRQVPFPVHECVPVTCYRPVTRVVPITYSAPQAAPSVQSVAPSAQGATASLQGS